MNAVRIAALGLAAAASGCMTPTLVRFNDREIEYESLWSAQFPPGAQVSLLGQKKTIRVEGDESIRVNGDEVWADEDGIRIGTRELRIAGNDRVVVDRRGQVHVVAVSVARRAARADTTTVEASTDRGEAGSASTKEGAPEVGSQQDTSPWAFLR